MRYIKLIDIVGSRLWRNKNNLIVYYYIACRSDYRTKKLTKSLRSMATEMGTTLSALRFALQNLEKDGLISIETTGSTTTITLPTNLLPKEQQPQEVTDPLATLRRFSTTIEKTLSIRPGSAHSSFETFLNLQELRGKKWKSDRELVAHFTNWWLKSDPRRIKEAAARAAAAEQEKVEQEIQLRQEQNQAANEEARRRKFEQEIREAAAKGNKKAIEILEKMNKNQY